MSTPTKHFFEYFNQRIPENWNEPALTDFDGTTNYTYGEMAQKMAHLQLLLENAGLSKGDKVVICSKNRANWAVAFLAIAANRGVIVSIMDAFVGKDIEKLVNHSDAKAMFADEQVWEKIDIKNTPSIDLVLSTEAFDLLYAKSAQQTKAYHSVEELFAEKYPNGYTQKDVNFPTDNLDDLMIINYTSGTTSDPKGVMLTYRNLSANVHYSQETIPNHAGWSEVCMLPLAHMFGLAIEFLYQVAGGCHVYFLSKTPSPSILMRAFATAHPYMILTVPLVIEKIFKSKIFPILNKPVVKVLWNTPGINKIIGKKIYDQLMAAFGGKLIYLITGGAALNQEVEKVLKKINFPFCVGYGMTECGPLICYEHWQKFVLTSCGKVVDRNELKIDSEDPQHVVGEILVKGEHVMTGYYKNEEATKEALDEEGWLHTGDLGLMDKDGNLYIKGRSKAMILGSNGQNIYPEELEDKMNNQTAVVESVVVKRDSQLVALVFPDYKLEGRPELGGKTLEETMQENLVKVNKQLPAYARISSIELVNEEFKKTPKRSIRRFLYK